MKAPLLFEFDGRRAVVFGAGPTGLRRALKYASYGAKVRVVAPEIGPDAAARLEAAGIEILREGYAPEHLDGNDLCTAATDSPELNRRIVAECRSRGVLADSASSDPHADFTFPAEFRRGSLSIAVSTGGRAPALDRQIREQFERQFSPESGIDERIELLGKIRELALGLGLPDARRRIRASAELDLRELRTELSELEGLKRNGRPDLPEQLEKTGERGLMKKLRIGTRGSKLALTQTEKYAQTLRDAVPGLETETIVIRTTGDKNQTDALNQIGSKGIFTKELETALLDGEIDVAVHSMKDMPSVLPAGLILAPPPAREDPGDVMVTAGPLPENPRIGTGSLRREVQLKALYPDAGILGIRGNVDTRIRKMKDGQYDAVVLAKAGLNRLGITEENTGITIMSLPDSFVPAPAQGILAAEIRKDDGETLELLAKASDPEAHLQMRAERRFLEVLEGSCHIPIGAHAYLEGTGIRITGIFGDEDGHAVSGTIEAFEGTPEEAGEAMAHKLKDDYLAKYGPVPGRVILAGAGCGDPDFITVGAVRALESCDTVVYDALANPELLDYAPDAEKIYVGKRASNHALTQDETNALLVSLARDGRNVVRLKGGDPYVFGRGGEEGEVLYDAGVPFEVIPGITSAIGGLGAAGIPVTHRDCNQAFAVVTGHLKSEENELDWNTLAAFSGTLVFLMGVKNLGKIADSLIAAGKPAATPAAVVHSASTPDQYVVDGTLGSIETLAKERGVTAPSLIVIGDVVGKREKLDFRADRTLYPLAGKHVIVTRARAQASELSEKLRALGAQALEYPTIRIETVPEELERLSEEIERLSEYTNLILTSANGVELFFDAMDSRGLDSRSLAGLHITAIGPATAKKLQEHGIVPDFIPANYIGESLIEGLLPQLGPDARILMPRSADARPYVAERLAKAAQVTEIGIYRTVPDSGDDDVLRKLAEGKIDAVTFTSSSTAKNFADRLEQTGTVVPESTACVSIGPQTSRTMEKRGIPVTAEAEVYNLAGLTGALTKLLSQDGRLL